ncbi:hypothetical protein [Aliterella atlantica]|uniref:Uncharacterized protein n=1 Tax=Aliterella atlantica CENA595 TaxID=1618023 RepID=A0A0D8ZQU0_9CYAN|nr:hypothetical protein UH38_22910 [Aliterella atlantica CENA595]
MPSELQWYVLCNLINGLPQIQWYVYQVEITGDFLYIHARSATLAENTTLFIINAQGEFI